MNDVQVNAPQVPRQDEVLTPDALAFVAELHRRYAETRDGLLAARKTRRDEIRASGSLDFLPDTREARESEWQVAPAPVALQDRRVEITGPTEP
ncbi:MAG: malate synthase A, partial [Nocardioidaceae bacterium]